MTIGPEHPNLNSYFHIRALQSLSTIPFEIKEVGLGHISKVYFGASQIQEVKKGISICSKQGLIFM